MTCLNALEWTIWESEKSWKSEKSNHNIVMNGQFVKNTVMNEEFVQNSVMNKSVDFAHKKNSFETVCQGTQDEEARQDSKNLSCFSVVLDKATT